jgi:hypothetical protein
MNHLHGTFNEKVENFLPAFMYCELRINAAIKQLLLHFI